MLYKIELVYSVEKHLWKYRNYFFKGTVFRDFSINDTEVLYDHLTNVTFERVAPVAGRIWPGDGSGGKEGEGSDLPLTFMHSPSLSGRTSLTVAVTAGERLQDGDELKSGRL